MDGVWPDTLGTRGADCCEDTPQGLGALAVGTLPTVAEPPGLALKAEEKSAEKAVPLEAEEAPKGSEPRSPSRFAVPPPPLDELAGTDMPEAVDGPARKADASIFCMVGTADFWLAGAADVDAELGTLRGGCWMMSLEELLFGMFPRDVPRPPAFSTRSKAFWFSWRASTC